MWQELRDYWLPLLLFASSSLVAVGLIALVVALPYVIEQLPFEHPLLDLFAEDATVRRSSIASAIGLLVTAFVFFRPNASVFSRRSASRKPQRDTIAGA
jgi:hypothetical protein